MRALRDVGVLLSRQREATVFVVDVLLIIYFGFISTVGRQAFFTHTNLITVTQLAAPIIILALGEVMLLICGEIDLSVGFIYQLSPFIMYFLITTYHVPGLLAILIALLSGPVIGWFNGFLTVALGLPSFIATLGTGFIINGIVLTTSNAQQQDIPPQVQGIGHWIGQYAWAEITFAVILTAIFHVLLTRTRWGLHTVATGGNQLGAREAGVSVARIARRPPDRVPDQHHRPDVRRIHPDVLRGGRRGHRRHRDARRLGHHHRRVLRRDPARRADQRLQRGRDQRVPAAHHLRQRHPAGHDRQRATNPAT
jgi:ABC-type glucose/galactose transport system permease subunit